MPNEAIKCFVKALEIDPRENTQDLLFKVADNKDAAAGVARVIYWYFDKLPGNIRNELLLKVASKEEAAENVANILAHNYDKLHENVRNLLFRLADNQYAARDVANALDSVKLPENVRNELLRRLRKI